MEHDSSNATYNTCNLERVEKNCHFLSIPFLVLKISFPSFIVSCSYWVSLVLLSVDPLFMRGIPDPYSWHLSGQTVSLAGKDQHRLKILAPFQYEQEWVWAIPVWASQRLKERKISGKSFNIRMSPVPVQQSLSWESPTSSIHLKRCITVL